MVDPFLFKARKKLARELAGYGVSKEHAGQVMEAASRWMAPRGSSRAEQKARWRGAPVQPRETRRAGRPADSGSLTRRRVIHPEVWSPSLASGRLGLGPMYHAIARPMLATDGFN
jgi:hypothetical protein